MSEQRQEVGAQAPAKPDPVREAARRRLDQHIGRACEYRAALYEDANAHERCGDAELAQLCFEQAAALNRHIIDLDAAWLARGGIAQ